MMRGVLALSAAFLLLASGCTSAPPPTMGEAPPRPQPPVAEPGKQPHPPQNAGPTSSGASPGPAQGGGHPRESHRRNESQDAAAWHKSLPSGLIHHHVDGTMELAKPSQATATVDGPNATAQAQAAGTVTDTLQVSPRMVVELTQPDNSDGFKIDPAERQAPRLIASDGSTT